MRAQARVANNWVSVTNLWTGSGWVASRGKTLILILIPPETEACRIQLDYSPQTARERLAAFVRSNAVFFDNSEKNLDSAFNTFEPRQQIVLGGNIIRQDPLPCLEGMNVLAGLFWNHDEIKSSLGNKFGLDQTDAVYFELAAEGRIGKQFLLSAAFIQALGEQERNSISKRDETINAQMAAIELAYQMDWFFPKISVLYASGDNNVKDGQARGFDGIFDNPQFAGAGFSYFNRENLFVGGKRTKAAFSLYSDLHNKFNDEANFVNPGLILLNTGFDAKLTTRLTMQMNFNYYMFADTQPLEAQFKKPFIGNEIGFEPSIGFFYKPFIVDNVIITTGASALVPGSGFKDLNNRKETLYNSFVAFTLTF